VPELLGAPDWVTSVLFDVMAKGEGNATREEISTLTEWLRQPSGRVVIDKTGLVGNYELTLRYTSDLNAVDAPSVFTALEEQLGLKLVPDRAPLQVLVVDHIERPTPD